MKGTKVLLAAMALVIVGATSAVAQADTTKKAPPAKVAPAKAAPAKAAAAKAAPAAMAPTFSEADIKAAQSGLAKGKFYTGTPSGKVDAATRTAIRKYQQANKLKVTGQLSDSLIAALKAAQ